MISSSVGQNVGGSLPTAENNAIPPVTYRATRGMVHVVNALQMALAESYIHGLAVPDDGSADNFQDVHAHPLQALSLASRAL